MHSFSTRFGQRVRAAVALAIVGFTAIATTPAAAKAPGQQHCYGGICHRVMTLGQTAAAIGKVRRISTSHYDDCSRDRFNPCGLTSSGEVFRPHEANNTASSIHPDGTILMLRHPGTKQAVVVRVNNFGPFKGGRLLDVSYATAERLGFRSSGVASLDVMVVYAPTAQETRYSRKRRYEPVPGFLGRSDSIESSYLRYTEAIDRQRYVRLAAAACHLARSKKAPQLALLAVKPPAKAPANVARRA